MRKPTVLIVLILALMGSPALSPAADDPGVPMAVFPEKSFTFDPVVDGAEVVHRFIVKNTGTGDLKVLRVSTG